MTDAHSNALPVAGAIEAPIDASPRDSDPAATRVPEALIGDFLQFAIHELRGPLNSIAGWAHMQSQDACAAGTRERATAGIDAAIRLQLRLLDAMVETTRLLGGCAMPIESVRLADLVGEVIAALELVAVPRAVVIVSEIPAPLCVPTGASVGRNMLWWLLYGAVLGAEKGVRIALSCTAPGMVLTVTSTGSLLPAQPRGDVLNRLLTHLANLARMQCELVGERPREVRLVLPAC